MTTSRAIIAYTANDGTWKGVWNDDNSRPQNLGRLLIRRVSALKGDLEKVVREYVDACPEGWASLENGERFEDAVGPLGGTFDGLVATCDPAINPLCFNTSYLYLFHVPKRRLYVFLVQNKPMRPFGMVTFEAAGKAKPTKFPAIEDET